ncbi:TRAP transporter substrate-binding protein DctP [Salipiger sp. P9]|uniref:TRAP transporter substrate-binding protein DctP n=1 Tax=Salipiger pentaromativorans TaxID=2943193 RepID=UPI00215834C2|nr:TRAP transporter substrate-binding protein DctP [Salipiger pentaromativorans]MCR8548142.1 TRAP transporter substrate-binding protein DctP [Salipiger pentaromativorans]
MNYPKTLIAAGFACLALAGPGRAETFRAATYMPPGEALAIAFAWWADEIGPATGGALDFQFFSSGSLVPAKSVLQSVGDGVAHAGFAYSGYTPSETPVTEAIAGFSFSDAPYIVLAAAYADFIMNDPEGYNDWRRHGVIPFGGFATPKYDLLCNTDPLRSLADLKGRKVRFPGGPMSQFGTALGMIPVNIPSSEAYQAQQTGQVDCSSMRPGMIIAVPMDDITKSVTHLATGLTFASPFMILNADMWARITPEQRRIYLDTLARTMAKAQGEYARQYETTLNDAPEMGIEVVEPDEEVKAVIREWVANYRPVALETARTTHGIADPEALFERFQGYIDKWEPILAGVENLRDEDALTAVFKEHLTDKLDVEVFGIE